MCIRDRRYTGLQINWTEFCDHVRHHFCGMQRDAELLAELYGQTQRQESAEIFILRKIKLFRRLYPGGDERTIIAMLTQQLQPRLRPALRFLRPTTLEELLQRAMSIEADLDQDSRARGRDDSLKTPWIK